MEHLTEALVLAIYLKIIICKIYGRCYLCKIEFIEPAMNYFGMENLN